MTEEQTNFANSFVALGGQIRAVDGEDNHFSGLVVPFTGADQKDLYDTYFDAETYYGARKGDGSDVFIQHGFTLQGRVGGKVVAFPELAGKILANPIRVKVTDAGLFGELWLNLNDEYEAQLAAMGRAGKLFFSSGALSHGPDSQVYQVDEDGHIRRWIIGEVSVTPTPGTPKKRTQVLPVRSFLELFDSPADTETATNPTNEMENPAATATTDTGAVTPTPLEQYRAYRAALPEDVRATYIGDFAEESATLSYLSDLMWSLSDTVWSLLFYHDADAEQVVLLTGAYQEFQALSLAAIANFNSADATADAAEADSQKADEAVDLAAGELRSLRAIKARFAKPNDVVSAIRAMRKAAVLSETNYKCLRDAEDLVRTVCAAHEDAAGLETPTRSAERAPAAQADPLATLPTVLARLADVLEQNVVAKRTADAAPVAEPPAKTHAPARTAKTKVRMTPELLRSASTPL